MGGSRRPVRCDTFADGVAHLRQFAAEHGHALVPVGYRSPDGFTLGPWVVAKRMERRAATLDIARARELQALAGWSWEPQDEAYEHGLAELLAYAGTNGHTRVPMKYHSPTGFKLGTWVFIRRQEYRTGKISAERVAALEAVDGWIWSALRGRPRMAGRDRLRQIAVASEGAPPDTFAQGVRELTSFAHRHGHVRVPPGHREPEGLNLTNWINNRRTEYKAGRLTPDEIASLEAVTGWSWEAHADAFEQGLQYLRDYVAANRSARVPLGYRTSDGFRLGSWVNNRRTEFRARKLVAGRAARLDEIEGWTWGSTRSK